MPIANANMKAAAMLRMWMKSLALDHGRENVKGNISASNTPVLTVFVRRRPFGCQ
jgi:hypothetical protein